MNNNVVNYLTIIMIVYAVFFVGCVEKETNISIETPTITMSPTSTPEQITEATTTPTPINYPNREEVIKYIADMKKVSLAEVKIIDFKNIPRPYGFPLMYQYQTGGYVAVSMIVANYTAIVMAYKNSTDVVILEDYTASTLKEKNLFDVLTNISFGKNWPGPFFGKLIPFNITIINPSYVFNKNDLYGLNSTGYGRLVNENSSYATFKFVSEFNDFHEYWPGSMGWVDVKTKSIWIQNQPRV